ncbi:nitroreductase-like protein [Leishmania donovani]|uniref:Nitroreductase-like_protein n=3 Tax=Leishmania donovani species complex TaxID=38574 RepID=A0A6L0WII2_LEIIN|nr:nitroreductase-like protein [Leishmania infantum JPCM5]TPP51835.1 Nitroreductase family protein [Leishmania donovani]CAC9443631.1 nitroreductase-like_protein [Leishmania infantum]CAJ1986038.1 nitroreductase-like protein [Leishmania donovani]CAM65376.1 nitroreductase-like protein [Leishmania infantum JPCM5]SUZ38987.1 nitroreductase-like_protein [Leishmania infantum]|eukprot:XP_001463029.1 nitroreductase-like protein [Leishmania infantum JPCM5]
MLRRSRRLLLAAAGARPAAFTPRAREAAGTCGNEERDSNTSSGHGGFLATLRHLVAWNRTNAAAAASSSSASCAETPACVSNNAALDAVEAVVRARWTCRQFDTAKPIDLDTLKRVLAATTRAPTGFNLQGWHAVVVTNTAVREQLFKAALGQPQVLQAPATVVFVGDTEPERNAPQALEMGLETGYYSPLYGAAYLRNIYYFMHGGPMQSMAAVKSVVSAWYSQAAGTPLISVPVSRAGYAWKQTMIPATTFVNLCAAAGWDTCMMEGIDEDAVKRALGVPAERYTVPVIISVGYATAAEAEKRQVGSSRFATPHTVRWNKF